MQWPRPLFPVSRSGSAGRGAGAAVSGCLTDSCAGATPPFPPERLLLFTNRANGQTKKYIKKISLFYNILADEFLKISG